MPAAVLSSCSVIALFDLHLKTIFLFEGISSSMNFDEEEDEDDLVSSSSSQLNSNTRPGSATSKKSSKVAFLCLFRRVYE